LLADPGVAKVIAPTRRALSVSHPKLENPVLDFGALESQLHGLQLDQVICCLGTTIKQAGSQERFREVDHHYPIALARLAKAGGATHYLVVTAAGSNARSPIFYNRVKGELERDLRALGFTALTIARPSLLLGEREKPRLGEKLAEPFAKLLPRKWRAIEGSTVAKALVQLAREPASGTRLVESAELLGYA
jgi:uncharacterized protein YbjT (DUF2867 family)